MSATARPRPADAEDRGFSSRSSRAPARRSRPKSGIVITKSAIAVTVAMTSSMRSRRSFASSGIMTPPPAAPPRKSGSRFIGLWKRKKLTHSPFQLADFGDVERAYF